MRRKFPFLSLWQFWIALFFGLGFFFDIFLTLAITLMLHLLVGQFKLNEPSVEELEARLIQRLLERSLFSVKDVSVIV